MPIVFLVRPANNAVAIELSGWAATLHNVVSTAAVYISADFASTAASRAAVDNTLPLNDALFFFGHGTLAKLLGATSDLVDAGNVALASGHAIVAIACSSADTLGPLAINSGVEAFIGFTRKLVWISGDPDRQFQPAICSGPESLMQGSSIKDATQAMQNALAQVENYYHHGAGRSSPNAAIGFLSALWDRTYLKSLGNDNFTL
jgi:hypothetical protein